VRLLTVVAAVGCILLAGCTDSNAMNTGPLGNGGTPGEECVSMPVGRILTYGFDAFTNKGTSPAVISKASLADPKGIRTLAAWIVPVTGHDLYGLAWGFPPTRQVPAGVQWAQRQHPTGAAISPSRQSNIVLVLELTARKGSADGIDVYYHVGSTDYHLRTATKVALGYRYCPN
jgi:hypothetical protein